MNMRGYTLIELLVALMVLSVGLLGGTALLVGALRDHGLALRHQAAMLLVADMAESVRAQSGRLQDTDAEAFAATARARFPRDIADTAISFEPATGAGIPAAYRITLSWRETDDAEAPAQVSLLVFVQTPVAG
jgi:type IV pilus modification protein PilV